MRFSCVFLLTMLATSANGQGFGARDADLQQASEIKAISRYAMIEWYSENCRAGIPQGLIDEAVAGIREHPNQEAVRFSRNMYRNAAPLLKERGDNLCEMIVQEISAI